jgi:hypothetical protein
MNKFYQFVQNNSGGTWAGDYYAYIIEAKDNNEADGIAESQKIYFDGVEEGIDCDCCGDRWNRSWEGSEKPTLYSKIHNENGKEYVDWSLKSIIIYKDGREEIFKV